MGLESKRRHHCTSGLADLDNPCLDQGAVRDAQHAERAVRLAAAVGGRAGIEDPQGLAGGVERDVEPESGMGSATVRSEERM